jgi:hypothetical protein
MARRPALTVDQTPLAVGGSIPSLPTRIISNDGPKGSSFCFQPMRESRLTRVGGIGGEHESAYADASQCGHREPRTSALRKVGMSSRSEDLSLRIESGRAEVCPP